MENRFEHTPSGSGSEQSPASYTTAGSGTTPMPTAPLNNEQASGAAAQENPTTPNWTYASAGAQQSSSAGYQQAAGAQGTYNGTSYATNPYASQAYTYQPAKPASAQGSVANGEGAAKFGKTFLAGFLGAALACAVGIGGFAAWQSTSDSGSGSTVLGGSGGSIEVSGDDATLAEAVSQKVLPSVVNIDVYTQQSSGIYGMFGMYGSGDGSSEETLSSLGSGVIISEDGYILTNQHVVSGADKLMVTLYDGNQYEATVVGEDASSDLAVVKVEADEALTAIEVGNSSDLTVGEWVMTAGSPYGLEQSVATGIVSATNRSSVLENEGGTAYYTNMIQTDAAINPGNSGGALVDSNGALIGINTMITSSSGSYSGVGFAIPVDYAMGIAQQIIDGKTPSHAQLGVTTATVNSQVAQAYGLSVDAGALITGVSSGGGAEAAGIQEGDVITKVNDTTIESATDLILAVRSVNPGDTAQVELNRNGETQTVTVTLGSDEGTTSNSGSNSGNGSNGYGYGYGGGNGGYGYGFGY